MAEFIKILESMEANKKEMTATINSSKDELLSAIENVNAKVNYLESEIMTMKNENDYLKELLVIESNRTEDLERQLKNKNLFIYGLDDTPDETKDALENKIIELLMSMLDVPLANEEIDNIKR